MKHASSRLAILAAAATLVLAFDPVAAFADEGPTCSGALSPGETAFVASVKTDLAARFPHAADAEKAGYVRYTAPDNTGAISYANDRWDADFVKLGGSLDHPSAATVVKAGRVPSADFIAAIFEMPTQ